eukprot:Blabericola_migrator_1__6468@NODE_3261_length_1901_cov_4_213195_g2041_i0_p1_GENE_NODE_3261_length_1901_cov_4_213195_g2041_i0NODE_3261_length_1901_cov_4_213195_g2041_i0_p1_ORF_typecomplete_len329_score38_51KH_5/PF13184_6/1_4e27KH_5/PF13184_6/6_5HHH_5/PF14520_6/0_028HHH_5/PF14520_6/0_0002DUF4332/PF14229_6/0_00096DUF4332/PF14229_6/0_011Cdd1/PF11731_8/3_2e02Cdd1/PF11731_8/0_022DNA_pol_lambd_f/PF10391_9/2_7DNA_pol_lambd_f/PF10391_9/6_4Herpes_ICP4_N/PF03584_15/0_021KH_2/PF07650_17/1_8e02KH_2/PF07650_1
MLNNEMYRVGDRLRGILKLERSSKRGEQLMLDRADEEMLRQLLRVEIPEIAEGLIELKAVAREAGIRSKVAVYGKDKRLDPIGACIGMRGARIQSVSTELSGEKIDLVLWDENVVAFVINAMSPADVLSVVVEEDSKEIFLAVEEGSLPQAIGRNGQNIRLASRLTGWSLSVMTQAELQEKQEEEARHSAALFVKEVGMLEEQADQLVSAGFTTLEELAYVPLQELEEALGCSRVDAEHFRLLARKTLKEVEESDKQETSLLQRGSELWKLPQMSVALAQELHDHGISTLEALAEQSNDELAEIAVSLSEQERNALIMSARQLCWFNK